MLTMKVQEEHIVVFLSDYLLMKGYEISINL